MLFKNYPRKEFKRCGKKNSYSKRAAFSMKNFRRKDGVRLRVYQCNKCDGWHLTKRL